MQWEGLDTELGNVVSTDTYSILTVTNATVRSEGVKICTGQCQRNRFQKKVDLKVYSLPDTLQLETQPKELIAGESARFFCSVHHVYPPGSLTLSWFRGDERLMASKEEEEEEEEEEEQLFVYRSEMEVPITAERTSYKCQAQLQVGAQTFHRSKVVTIDTKVTQVKPIVMKTISTLEPVGTSHRASSELSTTTVDEKFSVATTGHLMAHRSSENPTAAATEVTDAAAPTLESPASTSSSPTALGGISTGLSSPAQALVGETSRTASSSPSTFPLATETLAKVGFTSPGPPTATKQPRKPVSTKFLSTMDAAGRQSPSASPRISCRPVITTIPPQGTTGESLRISCRAAGCSHSVRVQWVETPLAESQYYKEEAEGLSTLTVESISLEHQGLYRCITLTSQPRMARVRIMVSPAVFGTSSIVAIGTAGSLLGLIITGYVSRRLWRRSS